MSIMTTSLIRVNTSLNRSYVFQLNVRRIAKDPESCAASKARACNIDN